MRPATVDYEVLITLTRVRRRLNLMATQILKPLGIGTKQLSVLRELSARGETSLGELARATFTDPTSTGKIVDALVRKGWVDLFSCPADKRSRRARLSRKGTAFVKKCDNAVHEIAERLSAPLKASQKEQFLSLLECIDSQLTKEISS